MPPKPTCKVVKREGQRGARIDKNDGWDKKDSLQDPSGAGRFALVFVLADKFFVLGTSFCPSAWLQKALLPDIVLLDVSLHELLRLRLLALRLLL